MRAIHLLPGPTVRASCAAVAVVLAGCAEGATAPEGAGVPSTLEIVSGEGQQVAIGSPFPAPVLVRAEDRYGDAIEGRTLTLMTEAGDGWVAGDEHRTGAEGVAELAWYAGTRPGSQELSIRIGALEATVRGDALPVEPGASHLGHRGFVEYVPGTLPLVVTAPHGGLLVPDDIPDREGNVTTVRDFATDEVAYRIGDALEELTGERPHLVIVHLRRTKLDANRDIGEAALGDPQAERAWYEFHHFTETAKAQIVERHGEGFYVDLHGHSKHHAMELGYLLTSADLQGSDERLDEVRTVEKSSLRTLAEGSAEPFSALVRGEASIGGLLAAEGYAAIPSPSRPAPDTPFFSGGPNVARHGCRAGGPICGYQLELNRVGVRDTEVARQAFAEAHARIMVTFFREHYGMELDFSPVQESPG